MELKDINIEDLKEAYQKLKTYVYYDNFNLPLRMKLAEYETKDVLEKSLIALLAAIQKKDLQTFIDRISTFILPKKIKPIGDNGEDKMNIVRNDFFSISKDIELLEGEYNHYIDAPIEIYLLDVLWIMKEGCYLITDEMKKNCYGNALVFDNHKDSISIREGHYLFERYFDKYQKWRDNGIKIAKEQINNNNNVLLICLDIQRFYPTSQIDFGKVRKKISVENPLSNTTELTDLLETIYIKYQSLINIQQFPQLPIGLLSSGVIANWYLNDFDISIKERFNPVYYGRYVDDIFMVLANIEPGNNNEWFDEKFLYGNNSPLSKGTDENEYVLSGYNNLRINGKKLRLFYFSPEYPLAVLDNFQKKLDENNSAFWFLPEDDYSTESLNNAGFDIIYEDSINKFREISGIKNSKYGVSVFLAKQIKRELICRDSNKEKIKEEIFKYFKGATLLDMYSLWEKVFTYFVVTNDKESFSSFERMIKEAIDRLKIKGNDEKNVLIKNSLVLYRDYCMTMAKALNTDFQNKKDKEKELTIKLRRSYLIRQHYLSFPIIIYTNKGIKEKNLVSNKIYTLLTQPSEENSDLILNVGNNSYWNPRMIHAYEICLLKFFKYIRDFSDRKEDDDYIQKIIKELECNNLCDKDTISNNENPIILKKSENTIAEIPRIYFNSANIKGKQKLNVALSNIKINNKDIAASIKGKTILDSKKRQRHFHLLNMATQENVDCLILPETSLPKDLLVMYAEHSRRKQQLVILGLEHIVSNGFCFNFSVAFLPYVYKGRKEVFILPRLKNHYSPNECREIQKYYNKVPSIGKAIYHLINWKGVQFTIFNCYELADVLHRSLFRSQIDILFAIEYNKDTYYYSNIVESTCRDVHCYFIQANTSDYGDSRLSIPKKHDQMTPVKLKGGDNDTIITFDVDITKLRDFQCQNPIFQNTIEFKNTPPGFDSSKVCYRNRQYDDKDE